MAAIAAAEKTLDQINAGMAKMQIDEKHELGRSRLFRVITRAGTHRLLCLHPGREPQVSALSLNECRVYNFGPAVLQLFPDVSIEEHGRKRTRHCLICRSVPPQATVRLRTAETYSWRTPRTRPELFEKIETLSFNSQNLSKHLEKQN